MAKSKKRMNLFCWGAFAYLLYKVYRYVTAIINISKELPVYLKNVIGDRPGMNLNVVFNRMIIVLSFCEETITEHPDIAEMAKEYIGRYYPIFRQDHITVQVIETACEKVAEEAEIEDSAEIPEKLEPEKK